MKIVRDRNPKTHFWLPVCFRNHNFFWALSACCLLILSACGNKENNLTKAGLDPANYAGEYNGKPTSLHTLRNANGMEVSITNFGGRVVGMSVPDKDGNFRDVVLGFDDVKSYFPENNQTDFGASIGRYANRIDHGKLPINGDTIQLPVNNFGHTLHGGPTGWQYQVYDVKEVNDSSITLTIESQAGDNNFPGKVEATVIYTLRNDNSLDISYSATTDAPTVINMTNHSYFNLSGNPKNSIAAHTLKLNSSSFTPVDSTFMVNGEIRSVENTPMDFRTAHPVGDFLTQFSDEQIKNANGYDHNFVLDTKGDISIPAAVLYSPETSIELEVFTTEPGIQVYSGNFLDGSITGKKGIVYEKNAGLCLETQHYPDSPNHPEWPSTLLNPGQEYKSNTIYKFSIK